MNNVSIDLEKDEALVLFEWLSSMQGSVSKEKYINIALDGLLGSLEKVLVEPFQDNYDDKIANAQQRILEK